MNIDGRNTLACLCRIEPGKASQLYPLPHMEVRLSHSHKYIHTHTITLTHSLTLFSAFSSSMAFPILPQCTLHRSRT
jgi:succinate dehydrogenase/fumarate reductase-like Fe-S protein